MKKMMFSILAVIMIIAITACTDNKSSVSLEEVQRIAEKEIPAINLMLGWNWDANNLPEQDFLIASAQHLYNRDNGQELPKVDVDEDKYGVNEGIKIDILIPAITKYYPFSEEMLRNSFESGSRYDTHTDAVVLVDGIGVREDAVMHDITDNQDGTYDVSYGLYTPQNILECTGVVKVKVHPDGYMQFLSNIVND